MNYLASLLDELLYFAENNHFDAIDVSIVSPNLKFKTLFMYFPEKFIPIFSEDHYDYLLRKLGIYNKAIKGIAKKQRQLLSYKLNIPQLKDMGNYEFAHYLYFLFGVPSYTNGEIKIKHSGILSKETIKSKTRIVKIREVIVNPLKFNSNKQRTLTKKDYVKETQIKMKTGFSGEQLVMDYEVSRLNNTNYSTKIQHVSLTDDSKGYDILSFEEDGSERYIEVKSTKHQITDKGTFYITENELKCADGKNYWIYYVTGVDSDNPVINLIENPFETQQISLTPISYRANFEIDDKN